MPLLAATVLIVLLVAAVFAAVEAALFSTSFARAHVLKRQNRWGSHSLAVIRGKMSRPVTTLVIGTNVTTIVGSLLIGHIATETYGDAAIGTVTAAVTALIIVFGELFPKVIGERYAEPIGLASAPVLRALTYVLSPLIWCIDRLTAIFAHRARKIVSEEELKILSEIGSREGSIEDDEAALIRRVFSLNDMRATDIMTPWRVVDSLSAGKTVAESTPLLMHKPYSRYPVVDSDGEVVGIVQAKALLIALARGKGTDSIDDFMMRPVFVPPEKRVDHLLTLFLSNRRHQAVVLSASGKPLGVVTFEDVLEQLVGEIVDETDEVVDLRKGR